ncbi:MAG: SPASM domain-containing protein, partial [Clostridia bacterium]|nr:SPASM domain-containing protein [Clostridia bacterium]
SRGLRIREKLFLEWGDRFQWPDAEAPVQGEIFFCYGMRDHFGILCDGTVVPCCLDGQGVIALGNLHIQSMEEILKMPRTCAIVEGFAQNRRVEALCRHCGYSQRFSK